jgi:hypothetical protein
MLLFSRKILNPGLSRIIQDANRQSGKRRQLAGSLEDQKEFGRSLGELMTRTEMRAAMEVDKHVGVVKDKQQEALNRIGACLPVEDVLMAVELAGGNLTDVA